MEIFYIYVEIFCIYAEKDYSTKIHRKISHVSLKKIGHVISGKSLVMCPFLRVFMIIFYYLVLIRFLNCDIIKNNGLTDEK